MRSTIFSALLLSLLLVCAGAASAATFTATKVVDTNDGTCDADCSFREAVVAANATVDNDTVAFSSLFNTSQTITLSLSEVVIAANGSLTITGPGANLLTLDGNQASRIITMSPASVVTLDGLTFTRGNGVSPTNTNTGGAIHTNGGSLTLTNSIVTGNQTTGVSGGIRNSGTGSSLTVINCTISNNTAGSSGGGIQSFSTSTVVISGSTISGNTNLSGSGGGLMVAGVGHIINSTFAGNTANGTGGGGLFTSGSLFTMTHSTIMGNMSVANGGGVHRGTTNVNGFIRNSIIAGNTGPSPDVSNSAGGLQSQGNNIIGNTGTSTGWVASDLLNTNPQLGPLANNGGPTQTFLPQSGSPAIEGGQNCVLNASCTANNAPINVTTDQRGIARPAGPLVDIGSVEVGAAASTATIIGRVLTANGRPIRGANVFISGTTNPVGYSSSLGYFRIEGVITGQSYQITATAKGYSFTPQTVAVNGNISDLVITAQPVADFGEQK